MKYNTRQLKEVEIQLKASSNSHRTILLVRKIENIIATILKRTGEDREKFMTHGVQYRILLYILVDHFLEQGNAEITKEEILNRSGYKNLPSLPDWVLNLRREKSNIRVLGWVN